MRRLIFINRFFYPDHSATSQILSDLAFHAASTGRQVEVVTSDQIYDAPRASLPERETINGVHVHRLCSTRFGRRVLIGRSIDYLSFYRAAWLHLMKLARPNDLIVAKTDPPLISVVAMAVAKRRRAGLINWLQDLYPEVAVALNVPFVRGPIAARLAALRNRSLQTAEINVAIGRLMGRQLERIGIPSAKILLIPNWCDDLAIRPLPGAKNPLKESWGLQDKFVLGYSGNLGRVHEFDTVLSAAKLLRDDPHVAFLMIGGGKKLDEMKKAVGRHGLDGSFRFMPYQEHKSLPYSLSVPDAHWLSLNPKLEGLLVPSKFYGAAAAGKPIIVIGDRNGEHARLVEEYGCGALIAPGDAAGLVDAVQRLVRDPQLAAELGARARKMLEARFTRRQALESWDDVLGRLDLTPANSEPASV